MQTAIIILAGGRSSRFDSQDKALIEFSNKPLIEYVIACARTHSNNILLSANRNLDSYRRFGLPIITDDPSDFQGPMTGIAKAMQTCNAKYLLTLPCDAPFIDVELIERLDYKADDVDVCVAYDGNRIQPAFARYKTSLLASLQEYMTSGRRKLSKWILEQNYQRVDISDHPEWVININSHEDFAQHIPKTTYNNIPILAFVGFSGSGKTTLLVKLIAKLKESNVKTAAVKHAHHHFDIDKPGKDSYRLRESGATQTIVASDNRFALIVESATVPKLDDLLARLDTNNLDLVLIESFKHMPINKIEVWRDVEANPVLYPDDENIIAIATDAKPGSFPGKLAFDLNNINKLTAFVLNYTNAASRQL